MKLLFAAIFPAVLLSSCATYREPAAGNEATLTCLKPKNATWLPFHTQPVVRIERIDGNKVAGPLWDVNRTHKLSPGIHRIAASGFVGGVRSSAYLTPDFRAGQTYTIEAQTGAASHLFLIKDAKGKLVTSASSYNLHQSSPTIIIPPAG